MFKLKILIKLFQINTNWFKICTIIYIDFQFNFHQIFHMHIIEIENFFISFIYKIIKTKNKTTE